MSADMPARVLRITTSARETVMLRGAVPSRPYANRMPDGMSLTQLILLSGQGALVSVLGDADHPAFGNDLVHEDVVRRHRDLRHELETETDAGADCIGPGAREEA